MTAREDHLLPQGDLPFIPRYVGARVARTEDRRLVDGSARFLDDLQLPGMLHLTLVRSTEAHATIDAVDTAGLAALPFEAWAVTGAELGDPVPAIVADCDKPGFQSSRMPLLASAEVRFVGEPVVAVLAPTPHEAEDAAEEVVVSYHPLPAVLDPVAAQAAGAPRVHDPWDSNVFIRRHQAVGDLADAERRADHVVRGRFRTRRHTGMPMENRGCMAAVDPRTGVLTLWSSTQIPHLVRSLVAEVLEWPEHLLRVVAPDVGGGFGIKGHVFVEEILVCTLAQRLGRPVKWVEDRREHLLASVHARDHLHEVEAFVTGEGRILGLRAQVLVDCGAYSVWPWTAPMEAGMAASVLPGPYDIQAYEVTDVSVATNKCPLGTYRGVARPSANFSIERLMDEIARVTGVDPLEVRLRNVVREFPYTSATGLVYDSGSYAESLETVREVLDYPRLRQELAAMRAGGRLVGMGLSCFMEQTAHGKVEFAKRGLPVVFGYESAQVTMDPHGKVVVTTGIQSHGQGLETTLAQIAADELGVDLDDVIVYHGDTAMAPYGLGTWGSRAAVNAGGAVSHAATVLRDQLLAVAAHHLEIAPQDLEIGAGTVRARGVPSKQLAVAEIARQLHHRPDLLPEDVGPGMQTTKFYAADGRGTFSNSCHAAVVEVDPDTGQVQVLRYLVVEDCGRMINPLIVEGQVHGGVAQGIGSALLEELVYDDAGQLVTTTLADYRMPSTMEIPDVEVLHLETLSPRTTYGIKGMGEGGAIAPMAAIANAVADAVGPDRAAAVNDVPLTPDRVWRILSGLQPELPCPLLAGSTV